MGTVGKRANQPYTRLIAGQKDSQAENSAMPTSNPSGPAVVMHESRIREGDRRDHQRDHARNALWVYLVGQGRSQQLNRNCGEDG